MCIVRLWRDFWTGLSHCLGMHQKQAHTHGWKSHGNSAQMTYHSSHRLTPHQKYYHRKILINRVIIGRLTDWNSIHHTMCIRTKCYYRSANSYRYIDARFRGTNSVESSDALHAQDERRTNHFYSRSERRHTTTNMFIEWQKKNSKLFSPRMTKYDFWFYLCASRTTLVCGPFSGLFIYLQHRFVYRRVRFFLFNCSTARYARDVERQSQLCVFVIWFAHNNLHCRSIECKRDEISTISFQHVHTHMHEERRAHKWDLLETREIITFIQMSPEVVAYFRSKLYGHAIAKNSSSQ